MQNTLKQIYKQIPKELLRNKWNLCFMLSNEDYYKIKDKLHNNRFMGIYVKTDFRIEQGKMYLY